METTTAEKTGHCERCGVQTESRIADIWLCLDCYVTRGSCCPEFGVDDLTDSETCDGHSASK